MIEKELKDISWQVSEEVYRQDPALSYSTLARYEREGFEGIPTLFDRIETPSLTFGSMVDSIITGGQKEFDERFLVADISDIPDNITHIIKELFNGYKNTYNDLNSIPNTLIINSTERNKYQLNWKPETRAKVIKEKGTEYYRLLYSAGTKTIVNTELYNECMATVRALKESKATEWYFQDDVPFGDNIKRYYQLKFKYNHEGVNYRLMADLIIVDYDKKIIYPIDLKTSGHPEYQFFKSFIKWRYDIQAKLYWLGIRKNLDADDYFKDFTLLPYKFIVVNKKTLNPLVWEYPLTNSITSNTLGKYNQIVLRDPWTIGKELKYYLDNNSKVPNGINLTGTNDLKTWINTL
jgi:hypothetical protein